MRPVKKKKNGGIMHKKRQEMPETVNFSEKSHTSLKEKEGAW